MTACTTSLQQHSSHLDDKLALRRTLPEDGDIWLPYCGFGSCSVDYADQRIRGCDTDRSAVEWWAANRPTARISLGRAESFDFTDGVFGAADIDPFGCPWPSLRHFLVSARITDPCAVVITDGSVQTALRSRRPYDFVRMGYGDQRSVEAREQYERWPDAAVSWLRGAGWSVEIDDVYRHGTTIAYARLAVSGSGRFEPPARSRPEPEGGGRLEAEVDVQSILASFG